MRLRLACLAAAPLTALAVACSSTSDSPPDPSGSTDAGGVTHTTDGGSPVDAATATPEASIAVDAQADTATSDAHPDAGPPAKQVLIWIWQDYANGLSEVINHASSFTHVSPALYQLNFDYASGPAKLVNENDDFSGISSAEIAKRAHAAGLKCVPLMYAGAGNFGTDQGIQNVLDDAPSGAQGSFIASMVTEGVTKGYDGFNLDWEVQGTDDKYSDKLVTFLKAFKSALNAKGMTLTLDIAGWYVKQCGGSGGTGLVDLAKLGDSVDQAIVEDYAGAFEDGAKACSGPPPSGPGAQDCDTDFGGGLRVMCNLPPGMVNVGLISKGTNGFADRALNAVTSYGFTSVSVWPDDAPFLNGSGIPNGATWYSLLADYLGK